MRQYDHSRSTVTHLAYCGAWAWRRLRRAEEEEAEETRMREEELRQGECGGQAMARRRGSTMKGVRRRGEVVMTKGLKWGMDVGRGWEMGEVVPRRGWYWVVEEAMVEMAVAEEEEEVVPPLSSGE